MTERTPQSVGEFHNSFQSEHGEKFSESHFFQPLSVELFYCGTGQDTSLPPEIAQDPKLLEQSTQRRRLYATFSEIFTQMGDSTDATDAVRNGIVDAHLLHNMYQDLTDFIETDENNARILLYLPFEILPDTSRDTSDLPDIAISGHQFAEVYRMEWIRLLHGTEPRANFVDGDILEPGLGEPEQISKAGHLTPELLKKGIITVHDVITLLDVIQSRHILQSLAEGVIVAQDRGLVSDSDWQTAQSLIADKIGDIRQSRTRQEEFYNPDSPLISPARARWLRKVAAENHKNKNTDHTLHSNSIDLSSPTPYDEEKLKKELTHLQSANRIIQSHPHLSSTLFPGFLMFGSRIKGYADSTADLDAAIFFRPEIHQEQRMDILTTLHEKIPEISEHEKFLEFWTRVENEKIRFQAPDEYSRVVVGEDQIHFVMGGVWIGDKTELSQIRQDMLSHYLDLSCFGDQKDEKRQQLLGQLELDALQYRLMHKGYRNHYSRTARESSANDDLIDWKSDFWDKGYRQIAAKLFVSRVFLPDLSKS